MFHSHFVIIIMSKCQIYSQAQSGECTHHCSHENVPALRVPAPTKIALCCICSAVRPSKFRSAWMLPGTLRLVLHAHKFLFRNLQRPPLEICYDPPFSCNDQLMMKIGHGSRCTCNCWLGARASNLHYAYSCPINTVLYSTACLSHIYAEGFDLETKSLLVA